ncbi:hypothetical protein C1701_00495 [Actinoalloteichus sp. AHMU CJ021]|uniref:lantibiotic dehydratase n=1 Tax=Actinoalloteichus sp. AHMU CJ021 TaxID=2072503 RepID=UPI000CA000C4|nr:hypothetical protein C1701_00495 [Actinoalloteichus sp. AHMU CJ021]
MRDQQPSATFSPYVMFRRGTLALAALDGLVPDRAWAALDAAEQEAEAVTALAVEVERTLHALVPSLPPERRAVVLRLRRDVHNGRQPDVEALDSVVSGAARAVVRRWDRARLRRNALLAESAAAYLAEAARAVRVLSAVASNEDFRRGVQLSAEDTFREVAHFAANPEAPVKPSRRRRVESTIASFAYRVVFKPSPFGSFTEVGALRLPAPGEGAAREPGGTWRQVDSGTRAPSCPVGPVAVPTGSSVARPDAATAPARHAPAHQSDVVQRTGAGAAHRISRARLNVGLLAWMAQRLRSLPGADTLLRIRLNNSLTLHDGRAVWLRRPLEGVDDAFHPDRVVDARHSDLVRLLVDLLELGDRTEREVRDQLVAGGLTAHAAAATLDQLVGVGLCHRGLGLPDQTDRVAGRMAVLLRGLGTPLAGAAADVLDHLQRVEDVFPLSDADRRSTLLAEVRSGVDRFVEICGCEAPARDALRSPVYEDVGTTDGAHSWSPAVLAASRDHLALFARLVPVLDGATVERLGLYRFVTEKFGETHPGIPFIEVFRAFSSLSPEEASAVMSGAGDPACAALSTWRAGVAQLADEAVEDGAEVARLDTGRLRALAEALPAEFPPWRSTAYRLQFARDADRTLVVVNGVTTGHGVFFSRFADLLTPETGAGWHLAEEIRSHLAATEPRQADLTAVLGLNFNLHPRLSPLEVIYPGSVASGGHGPALTLADLRVRPEPVTRRLELVSSVDGERVDLVPMNFLYPAAAPPLYRFLCAFAPTRTYRGGLWEQLDRIRPASAGSTGPRPRLRLGDLVLDRRTWRVPVDQLAVPPGLERREWAAVTEFERRRRELGLPRHSFFRVLPPAPPDTGVRDLAAETRRWALEARTARLRKPHYLDTRNPLLSAVLARQALSVPDGTVVFQECLPGPGEHPAPGSPGSAEEFLVELTVEGGHR